MLTCSLKGTNSTQAKGVVFGPTASTDPMSGSVPDGLTPRESNGYSLTGRRHLLHLRRRLNQQLVIA